MFVDMHLDESIRKKRNIAIGVDSISLESLLWSNFILVRYIFKTYVRMLKNIRTLYSMCTSLWAIYFAHSSYKIVHFISYDWRHQIFFISFQSIDTPRISSFFLSLSYLWYNRIDPIFQYRKLKWYGYEFYYNPLLLFKIKINF